MTTSEVLHSERHPMLPESTLDSVSVPLVPSTHEPTSTVTTTTTVVRKHADTEVQDNKGTFLRILRPLTVELIGTCLFILVGMWGACSDGGVVQAAFAFGLALMVFAASFGHISGVHFNPAVTLGIFIAGEIEPAMAVLYIIMQLLGGIAAGGILHLLLRPRVYNACSGGTTLLADYPAINRTADGIVTLLPPDSVQWWEGIFIELIVTFILVTVILMVALDTKSKTGLAPVIIGFTLTAAILGAGARTGGSLNPARSLGPAIFANKWAFHYVYWVGPLVGGALAGVLYRAVWAHHDRRLFVGGKRAPNAFVTKQ